MFNEYHYLYYCDKPRLLCVMVTRQVTGDGVAVHTVGEERRRIYISGLSSRHRTSLIFGTAARFGRVGLVQLGGKSP